MNITGLAISKTIQPPIKLPGRSAGSLLRPVSSSAGGELNAFVSLLSGLINRTTIPLPTLYVPVTSKYKSKEPNSEKQSTAAADQTNTSEPPIVFGAPQFIQIASPGNDQPDGAKPGKQPGPATDESKTAAPRTTLAHRTIDSRPATPDLAFGLRLTKNQPATQVGGPAASDSLAADLSPAPDVPDAARAASDLSTGGVASPAAPPLREVSETPGGDNSAISKDSMPAIRPETARLRISVPEKVMPPALQPHSIGGKDSGNAEKEQREPEMPAPKQNRAAAIHHEGRVQANSDTNEVSPSQYEITRTTGPQGSRGATNRSDSRKVASDPEISSSLQPQPARHISLKLTGPDSTKVDLQLTERSGKMQIAVRTPDHALAKSMQTDLSDLVGRLENKGFKAEAWIPTSGRHAEAVAAPQQSNQGNSQSHQGRHSGGSGLGQQQQRQGQNDSNQRQQARWKAQLEETSSVEEIRMENI